MEDFRLTTILRGPRTSGARPTRRQISILLLGIAVVAPNAAQDWPPKVRNLQVLPEGSTGAEVIEVMRGINTATGLRCENCHVGEAGAQLSTFDFAADDKELKRRAREMLRMTRAINESFLSAMDLGEQAVEVRCVTCHRGTTRPEQLSDRLASKAMKAGVLAAEADYRELRAEYYGRHTYDFGESSLILAAEPLGEAGRTEDAIHLLELNLEHHPDASWTMRTLGTAYERAGRIDDALDMWSRVLAKNPDSERTQKQVQRLIAVKKQQQSETDGSR